MTLGLRSPSCSHAFRLLSAVLVRFRAALEGCGNLCALLIGPNAALPVWMASPRRVKRAMVCGSQKLKIFEPVVGSVFVLVVDMLAWIKVATKVGRHDVAMLKNVARAHGHRVLRHPQVDVAIKDNAPSARPLSRPSGYLAMLFSSWINSARHEFPRVFSLNYNMGAAS